MMLDVGCRMHVVTSDFGQMDWIGLDWIDHLFQLRFQYNVLRNA